MKRLLILFAVIIIGYTANAQDVYSSKNVNIKFFSSAPLEDIEANTANGISVLTTTKNDFVFSVQIKSFTFAKSLMQEHFNENYMESDKYPDAKFTGKINEPVDWKKDGTYSVTVTGKLTIHGVDRDRTIPGKITVKGNNISISSEFDISCTDHKVNIPKLMTEKIAETVKVTVKGDYAPFVKAEKR
jgi:hypothetical protein